jgi:hypothetical protein
MNEHKKTGYNSQFFYIRIKLMHGFRSIPLFINIYNNQ